MRKKVLSLLLASVMVVSLAACGGDKTPANGESSSSVQDSSQAGGDNTGVTGATYTYHTYSSALATNGTSIPGIRTLTTPSAAM